MEDMAQISIAGEEDHITVVGGGTLDLTNSKPFHDGLKNAALSAEMVTVDLSDAVFIDTAIVQDLATAGVTMLKRGKRLKVIAREGAYPLRVLRISGFEGIMDIAVESE